jgi:hypothetical protein
VNVYVVPFERPVIVIGDEPPVAVCPRFDVTVYEVIVDPPLFTGALKEIVTSLFPLTAVTFVGALGAVTGVTELLEAEAILVPATLVAVTVNVYAVPFESPVTIRGDEPPVAVCPRFEVTVYEVIVDPPLFTGGVNEIVASPLPPTATMFVGESGTAEGTTRLLITDTVLVPTAFVAVTVNAYVVPFKSPVIVIGDEPLVAVWPRFDVTV